MAYAYRPGRWTHRGPLHWLTSCWHPLQLPRVLPGHCPSWSWDFSDLLVQCCICDRVKLNGGRGPH